MSNPSLPRLSIKVPEQIISSGEAGVELGALVGAEAAGIMTGGYSPLGFKTEKGFQPVLGTRFHLRQSGSEFDDNLAASELVVVIAPLINPRIGELVEQVKSRGKSLILIDRLECPGEVDEALLFTINNLEPATIFVTGNSESEFEGATKLARQIFISLFSHFHVGPYANQTLTGVKHVVG